MTAEQKTAWNGSVRYDAAQTLTNAQKTQARANIAAAPSGGGVMERVTEVAASSASESYDTFCAKLDAVLATMPSVSVKFLRVYPPQYNGFGTDICALCKWDSNFASVYTIGSYNYGRQGFRMIKRKRDGSDPAGQWEPLEYINPEMTLGVEYRTTERYLGKPVYVKLVDCGNVASGAKTINFGYSDSQVFIISVHGVMKSSSGKSFAAPRNNGTDVVSCHSDGSGIVVWSKTSNYESYTINCLVKYTKTTD